MTYRYALLLALLSIVPVSVAAQNSDTLTVRVFQEGGSDAIPDATVSLFHHDTLVGIRTTGEDGLVGFGFGPTSTVRTGESLVKMLESPVPHPIRDVSRLAFTPPRAGEIVASMHDVLGSQVVRSATRLGAGHHALSINPAGLTDGVYLIRLSLDGIDFGTRMVVVEGAADGIAALGFGDGGGGGMVSASKAATDGYRLIVEHPDYQTEIVADVSINGPSYSFVPLAPATLVPEFGNTRGIEFVVIADASTGLDVPRDLQFHPQRTNELWVVNRAFDGTVTYWNPGTDSMEYLRVRDENANHFMEEVSAIAFGDDDTFGTAQETNNTYDNQAPGNNFMGPALWSADTSIYSKHDLPGWGGLGSHLDMLHESPFGMGIAHDHDNVYWYFDGFYSNIVRYDFGQDHGPGHDDHSDGIVRRYVDALVRRLPGVPGHMILDSTSGWLYIADPGQSRVTRLDTRSGERIGSGNIDGSQMEQLREYSQYGNATYEVFVEKDLVNPSGIAIHDGRLFVSDNATGAIHAYSLETGARLNWIATDADSIMGLEIGPDGQIWFVDAGSDRVIRVDPGE